MDRVRRRARVEPSIHAHPPRCLDERGVRLRARQTVIASALTSLSSRFGAGVAAAVAREPRDLHQRSRDVHAVERRAQSHSSGTFRTAGRHSRGELSRAYSYVILARARALRTPNVFVPRVACHHLLRMMVCFLLAQRGEHLVVPLESQRAQDAAHGGLLENQAREQRGTARGADGAFSGVLVPRCRNLFPFPVRAASEPGKQHRDALAETHVVARPVHARQLEVPVPLGVVRADAYAGHAAADFPPRVGVARERVSHQTRIPRGDVRLQRRALQHEREALHERAGAVEGDARGRLSGVALRRTRDAELVHVAQRDRSPRRRVSGAPADPPAIRHIGSPAPPRREPTRRAGGVPPRARGRREHARGRRDHFRPRVRCQAGRASRVNDANATTSKSAKKATIHERVCEKLRWTNCRTDKPSSNVESRTVKFEKKRAAHSCFRPSVLRST